jgi:hypothetical protein
MQARWFYGVSSDKTKFQDYMSSEYTYEKLISIHPLELREICTEMKFFANKLNVELPDYIDSMIANPVSFYEAALDRNIEPDYSEITKINLEQGTAYRNIYEYLQEIKSNVPSIKPGTPNDPLMVLANEDDTIDDESDYLKSVLKD